MALTSPDRIEMSPSQQQRLRHLIRAGTTAQQLVMRARIILLAAAGLTNTKIAARVGVCVDTVRKWRHRWWVQPGTASLGDAKRSGRPPSFTPVQVAAVIALACQPPEASGVPLSRWSCPDLAAQVVADGIAASVSTSTIRRWLGRRRDQTLAVPVLDLRHRPGLRRQGRPGPGPVQQGLGRETVVSKRLCHLRRRKDLHPSPVLVPPLPAPR